MKGYQIVLLVIVFLILGYYLSEKAFGSTGKLGNLFGNPDDEFESGKSYIDPVTGGEIQCYNLPPSGIEPNTQIFKANTEPPILGNLYKKTSKTVCYLFPKS